MDLKAKIVASKLLFALHFPKGTQKAMAEFKINKDKYRK